jgi:hypothetical protein
VAGSTAGALTLSQTATGGNAGTTASAGGNGGAARSVLQLSDTGAVWITATVNASGGTGATPGTSLASVDVTGIGSVTTIASAGNVLLGGRADAAATAKGAGAVLARSTSKGALGSASATATTVVGRFSKLAADARAPVVQLAQAETRAGVGTAAPAVPAVTQFQAVAYATGSPTVADADAALGSNAHLRASLQPSRALTLMTLGASSAQVSGTLTYTTTVSMNVDLSDVSGPADLLLGMHDPTIAGGAFTSLEFVVRRDGIPVLNKVFGDASGGVAYFTDHVVDLGAARAGSSSAALDFQLNLTTSRAGDGMLANFFLGTAPTIPGDATHDGRVGFADLVLLAQNYNGNGMTFEQGDFDGDGLVNFADLVLLAQHYNTTLPSGPVPGAGPDFRGDLTAAFATVPEPGSGALLMSFIFLGLGGGRRRRRRDQAPCTVLSAKTICAGL